MNKRALRTALICALLGVAGLFAYLQKFEHDAVGGSPVKVLIALKDIKSGTVLNREIAGLRTIPERYVDNRQIRASDFDRVDGMKINVKINANEYIVWTDFGEIQRQDLSALISNGRRAVTVSAANSGAVKSSDRVDVLLTSDHTTKYLLQNMLVLEARGGSVTFSATLEEASVLTLASQVGRLSLVLRNASDIKLVEDLPPTTRDTIIEAEKLKRYLKKTPSPSVPIPL